MQKFFENMVEALDEEEEISQETVLKELETWDSLGALSVTSMIGENYGVTLFAEDYVSVVTVGDLWQLVESRMGK